MKTNDKHIRSSFFKTSRSKSFILKFLFVLMFIILASLIHVNASDNNNNKPKHETFQELNVSYIFGGQIFNDNFIYNPGYSFDISTGAFLNNNIGFGIGTGYKSLVHESFIPIYGEIIGYKNKKNTSFINMKLGYSFAWSKPEFRVDNYKYKGGVFISAGMGRKIKLNDKYSAMLHWSYQHQFAKMEYNIFSTQEYSEVLNYDMIVISIGFIKENR